MENGTCESPVKHEIVFTRAGSCGRIEHMALCVFVARSGDSLEILQEAVTCWVNDTAEGLSAYDDSSGDFNIGDLACCQTPDLLEPWGVFSLKVRTLHVGDGVHTYYDKNLYKE